MSLHAWFMALDQSALGEFMHTSRWGFAVVEAVHLLALAVLGGSVLIVDLRLLGLVFRSESSLRISRDLGRFLLGSLLVMILSGIGLLSEEAGKCYYSPAFRWKMVLLACAIVFYFTLHRRALLAAEQIRPPVWARSAAVISMTLWLGVGVAGRTIGLL
jgi:hypothetical protein